MQTIEQLLAELPVFAGLPPEQLALIAGCARTMHAAAGDELFREGDPADAFYVAAPRRDRARDAHARRAAAHRRDAARGRRRRLVVAVPAVPLALRRARRRGRARRSASTPPACAARPTPTRRSATSCCGASRALMLERLQATRLRLLDVYGTTRGAMSTMTPQRVHGHRTRGRRRPTRGRSSSAPTVTQRTEFAPGQFNMLYAFGHGESAISISGDPARDDPLDAHRARGRPDDRGDLPRAAGRRARRARPVRQRVAGRSRPRAATSSSSPAASASRRCGRRSARCSPRRERYGRVAVLYGGRSPDLLLYRSELEGWQAREDVEFAVTVDAAGRDWSGRVGVVPGLVAGAAFDPARTVALVCGPEVMMRFAVERAERPRRARRPHPPVDGAQHAVRRRPLRPLPARPARSSAATARSSATTCSRLAGGARAVSARPKLAVWKFASCDGCQLSLLDCEDELLAVAGEIEIAHFLEAVERRRRRALRRLARRGLDHDAATTPSASGRCGGSRAAWSRSAPARRPAASRRCATSPTSTTSWRRSTRRPSTSRRSRPRRRSATHVEVDFELHGCPIDRRQLLELLSAYLNERRPRDRRRTASAWSASGAARSA